MALQTYDLTGSMNMNKMQQDLSVKISKSFKNTSFKAYLTYTIKTILFESVII